MSTSCTIPSTFGGSSVTGAGSSSSTKPYRNSNTTATGPADVRAGSHAMRRTASIAASSKPSPTGSGTWTSVTLPSASSVIRRVTAASTPRALASSG